MDNFKEFKKKVDELEIKVARMRIKQRELEMDLIEHKQKHDAHLE